LSFSVPPRISRKPPVQITKETSDDVRVPCSADGFPPPDISFSKETGDKTAWTHATIEKRIEYETGTFIIRNLKVEDSGDYACIAKSRAGRVIASVNLVVMGLFFIDIHNVVCKLHTFGCHLLFGI